METLLLYWTLLYLWLVGKLLTIDDEDFDQETPAPSSSVQPATPATLLNTYNLCFDPERRFLSCTTCKYILSFEVARHLRRVHQATISNVAEAIILRSFDVLQFQPDFQVLSPVIPFLPLLRWISVTDLFELLFDQEKPGSPLPKRTRASWISPIQCLSRY